jgi:hypothetical protein
MPKELERKLIAQAKKHGWYGKKGLSKRGAKYVYGTMEKIKKSKGGKW